MTVEDYFIYVIMPILSLSLVLIFIRFLKGPSVGDRVVALDLIITVGVGIIGVFSLIADDPVFLDVAMILALIAFLSTVAFSNYLIKRNRDD
ncbi:MAG: cation:proton antiporter [Flavobacteriaceae bacterium]|jgi:multicomponent Na+:H+ antiporter subunit F|nr:cation:proton antiporter [Flavobacteriaceae bacterium]